MIWYFKRKIIIKNKSTKIPYEPKTADVFNFQGVI